DISAAFWEMEGRVDHTLQDAGRQLGNQLDGSGPTADLYNITVLDSARSGILRMNFQIIMIMPADIFGTTRLCTDIVLRQDSASGQQEWITLARSLICRYVLGNHEASFAADKLVHVHDLGAIRSLIITRPLYVTAT